MKDAPQEIIRIVGVLSRSGYDTMSTPFVVANDTATCEFDNLATGVWHLVVNAYNANDRYKAPGRQMSRFLLVRQLPWL